MKVRPDLEAALNNALPDSPQQLADMIGLGIRLTRQNLALIFKVLLVPSIFTALAGIVCEWIFTDGILLVTQTKSIATGVGLFFLWSLAATIFLGAWWILGLRLLALTRLVLGFSPTYEESLSFVNQRKWNVLGVYFLGVILFVMVASAAGFLVFITAFASGAVGSKVGSGIATAVGLFIAFWTFCFVIVIYLLACHVSFCVFACEDLSPPVIISRSLQLIFKHLGRSIAFGVVFSLILLVVSRPLMLPVDVMTVADALQRQLASSALLEGYRPPLYLLIFAQSWESLIGMVIRPMVMFCFGLFYYDLRLRGEGLDIGRRLALLEASAR